jgi:hypothetical protein
MEKQRTPKEPAEVEQGPINQGDEAEKIHREADPVEPIFPVDAGKSKVR